VEVGGSFITLHVYPKTVRFTMGIMSRTINISKRPRSVNIFLAYSMERDRFWPISKFSHPTRFTVS